MRLFILSPNDLATTEQFVFDPGIPVKPLKTASGDAFGIMFAHFVNNQMVHTLEVKDKYGKHAKPQGELVDQIEINYSDGSAYLVNETTDLDEFYDEAGIWLPVSMDTKLIFSAIRQLEKSHRVIGLFDSRNQRMAFRSKIFTIAANASITVIAQKVGEKTKYLNRIAYDGYQIFTQGEILQERDPEISVVDRSCPQTVMAEAFRKARERV